jgi:hypothetical protein
VVNVTDSSDVYVRLAPLELGLSHWVLLRTLVYSIRLSVMKTDAVRIGVYLCYSGEERLRISGISPVDDSSSAFALELLALVLLDDLVGHRTRHFGVAVERH